MVSRIEHWSLERKQKQSHTDDNVALAAAAGTTLSRTRFGGHFQMRILESHFRPYTERTVDVFWRNLLVRIAY